MAKKKKKNASPTTPVKEAARKPDTKDSTQDEEMSYIEVKVRRSETKAASASLRLDSSPTISMDESDAAKLQLQKNDPVMLFLKDPERNSNSISGAIICKADVLLSLGRSPDKTARRKSQVVPGTCTVQPSYLLDSMVQESEPNLDTSKLQTPVQSPPPSTPQSTPRSGFSFAKGGGGDALINSPPFSPASPYASPQSKQAGKSTLTAWIVSLASPLGKDAESVLCTKAKTLHIQVQDETEASRLQDCGRILKELFLAQTKGLYVHERSTVAISFRGKSLKLQMQRTEANPKVAEERRDLLLELEMETLDIQDEFPDEDHSDLEAQLWTRLRVGLENESTAQHLLLYKIDRDTQISFSGNTEEENSDATSAAATKVPQQFVAGLSSTMDRVKNLLLSPLLRPELFSTRNLQPPRGVLLHGDSGVGKSCLARQLAQDLELEHPGQIRVQSVNCAELQSYSAHVGEAERRLCRIFEQASLPDTEANKDFATLLIFDDIQLICSKRSGYNPGSDRLAATLLGLLDGIGSTSSEQKKSVEGAISNSIVILAITNDPSKLDPALRRPGRLEFEVEVPGPDEPAVRADIIRFHLDYLSSDYPPPKLSNEEYLALGELARGFNGADCMLAVKEAILMAILRDNPSIGDIKAVVDRSRSVQLTLADLKSAIRKTKPSAIKTITVEIPTVHWSSIGGMETVKEQLRDGIELPEKYSELFARYRIPAPRGILLYGPPGCSKTLMARALATEGKMNFLAVKGPELLSKWLGESERALASLFRRARLAAPSIIFFDEVDAIAAQRGSGGINTGGGRLLSQLLTEMDGINTTGGVTLGSDSPKNPRVVVVAATNRPDLIDVALMRPGRIDKKIYVGVPDEKSRHRIFEIGLKGRACSGDIDLLHLAKEEVSGGFSGAELIGACKDAAFLALEEDDASPTSNGMPSIKMRHLLKSINSMQRQITPEMIKFYQSFSKSHNL